MSDIAITITQPATNAITITQPATNSITISAVGPQGATGAAGSIALGNEAADTTCFLVFATTTSGNLDPKTNSGLTFDALNVSLASTTFVGALTGNSSTTSAANGLKTATTTVVISAATAPTAGQVLTASSTTLAAWATPASGTPTAITVADEATDTTCFVAFVTAATGDLGPKTNTGLTFNSSTAALTAKGIIKQLAANGQYLQINLDPSGIYSYPKIQTNSDNLALLNTLQNFTMGGSYYSFTNGSIASLNLPSSFGTAGAIFRRAAADAGPALAEFYTYANVLKLSISEDGAISSASAIISTSPISGVGYSTGAGGAVTQATSRTTGVTLNKITGAITLVSAAGSATAASFTVTCSAVAATDTIQVCQKSGTDLYLMSVTAVSNGSFKITFFTTGGTTTEQPVFNFTVLKGVVS